MPELPEVEIARRCLVRWFDGRSLVRAVGTPSRVFRGAERARFEALAGPLTSAERKGKYLMLGFGEQGLVMHLGMTGKLVKRPQGQAEPYSRARFELDSGEVVHFRDPRMFGHIEPAPTKTLPTLKAVAKLGRDPLVEGLDARALAELVGPSRQALKVALMDQERIAGLGNIHAAEALFRAGLHPARAPGSLSSAEWKRLAQGIRAALDFALVEQDSDEIRYVEEPGSDNPFLVYGRAGTPCRKCKTTVKSMTQGGRTTHYCPKCQPKGAKR
ncbi:MAG: bifunctional DNA-formamidopyrimidine glycosylase/DNA-(apurinic or apyrimidinic site) lyase [Myxococcaceae bacterium]|nr:bifunctional DNA-formamidopyrimidine glycosylase/DNA-(apurinic or apyrimidinic site) lyase [Myxococcaceae bacterium]